MSKISAAKLAGGVVSLNSPGNWCGKSGLIIANLEQETCHISKLLTVNYFNLAFFSSTPKINYQEKLIDKFRSSIYA